jgi:hypothetical protein
VDEAALRRLRDAISAEVEDDEEQLNGVLRMLGAAIPDETQLTLFARGQERIASQDGRTSSLSSPGQV